MSSMVLNKPAISNSNDCTQDRAGIFDQFTELEQGELCYYAVFSNSDFEGNIIALNVKREKFNGNVAIAPDISDRESYNADQTDAKEEIGGANESSLVSNKRYGFRTRRLKDHRIQDFDTSMCESNEESCESEPEYTPPSDDKPYAHSSDNWPAVRGSGSKQNGETIKTRNSHQRQQPDRSIKKETQSRTNSECDKTKPILSKIATGSSNKSQNGSSKMASNQLQSKPPVQKINLSTVDVRMTSQKPLKEPALPDTQAPVCSFPKKSPNKIRFGYNSTAPKVPEMKPIKRRQLRQTASRTTTSTNTLLSDVSSSSDGETPISMKTRVGLKTSRISDAEIPVTSAPKSAPPQPTNPAPKQEPIVQNTVTSGKGLKMVFRRQSVETKAASLKRNDPEQNISDSVRVKDEVSDKKHNVKVKKFAKKATKEHQVEKRKLEYKTSTDSNISVDECSPEIATNGFDDIHKTETTSSTTVAGSKTKMNNGQSELLLNDEHTKKKKSKKKKKKGYSCAVDGYAERGRSASNASIEEACDAEYTAMRLAMELPRHNWLVKHLIKANKLKAEDDKPLNTARETDQSNGSSIDSTSTAAPESKQRGITADPSSAKQGKQSTKSDSTESKIPSEETKTKITNLREETLNCEDLRSNPNNYCKGSSMVGIVKPFQHLKMSPTTCKGGDASPSRLCIIDEEETQNETAETSTAATGCENKQVDVECATFHSDSIVANSNENNPVVIAAPVVVPLSYPAVKSTPNDDRTRTTEPVTKEDEASLTEQSTVVKVPSTNDHQLTSYRNGSIDNQSNSNPVTSTNTNVSLPTKQGNAPDGTIENGTDNEIQIFSCFSLALDLTTKVQIKTENNNSTPNIDQPLDLSMKTKSGDISPKILDLSVKKQPSLLETPSPSSYKNAEAAKPKIPESKPMGLTAVDYSKPTTSISSPLQDNNTQSNPPESSISSTNQPPRAKVKSPVIVIEDETNMTMKNLKSNQRPSSNPTESPPSLTPQTPSTSESTPNPMKRCASLDATSSQMIGGPEQRKRARMSLDDSRLSTNKPTVASPNRNLTGVKPGIRRKKNSTEKITSPLPTIQSHASANAPVVLEKPFVVSRPSVPHVHTDKAPLYASESTIPQVPTQAPTQLAFSSSQRPSSYRPPAPFTPSTSMYNGTLATASKYPTTTEHPAKARTVRSRSVQSSNVRAQMIAQAYQPDIGSLEPYIKAQQRAVDEKIKELEAIKRQLADASENNKNRSPTHIATSYPRPAKQIRQHYHPPVQISMPIPKPVITTSLHPGQVVITHSPMPHRIGATIQTNQPRIPHPQQIPRPTLLHGAHLKQRALPPRWRALPPTHQERPPFVVHRPVPNGNPHMESNSVRQTQPARMMNSQNYPRLATSSSALAPSQVPVPRAYSHSAPGPRLQPIPTPRLQLAPGSTPVYRNGGLTVTEAYRTQLNEPIVIEDDLAHQANSQRPGFSSNSTHSLKIRRAHSYHPPLSKNQNQQTSQRQTMKVPGSNAPESKTESCARCGGKAYFLCSGCRKIWYCNKNCQLQDWSTHSSICNG